MLGGDLQEGPRGEDAPPSHVCALFAHLSSTVTAALKWNASLEFASRVKFHAEVSATREMMCNTRYDILSVIYRHRENEVTIDIGSTDIGASDEAPCLIQVCRPWVTTSVHLPRNPYPRYTLRAESYSSR